MQIVRSLVSNQFEGLSRFQGAYYAAFLLALFLCLSPSNVLGYIAPAAVLMVVLIFGRSRTLLRNLLIWLTAWLALISLQAIFSPQFAWNSAILSMVTYSTFAVVICIPPKRLASLMLHNRIMLWVQWVVVIEAIIGIIQAIYAFSASGSFDVASGDYVEGTIHIWLAPELSFSNPMYAANMTLMLLALVPLLIIHKKGVFAVSIGIVAIVMASVIHMLLFVAAALFISFLIFRPLGVRDKQLGLLLIAGLAIVIFSVILLRSNFASLQSYANIFLSGRAYKSQAVASVVNDLPIVYPRAPFVGIGPGQYSSRAGLIGTGQYFGPPRNPRNIPYMPTGMSLAFENNVLELWKTVREREILGLRLGSTDRPFFSWLSVYAELGVVGLGLIFGLSVYALWKLKKAALGYEQLIRATFLGASILFVLLLGLQENYWEVPQALLIGFMLIQLKYAILVYSESAEHAADLKGSALNHAT